MITVNAVYTQLHNALGCYCTRNYEPVPPSFPCMYFREDHFRPRENVNIANTDNVRNSTVHIELYAKSEMQDLIDTVETTMRGMHYIEDSCIQIDNADISIQRYSLTFSRIICEEDTL